MRLWHRKPPKGPYMIVQCRACEHRFEIRPGTGRITTLTRLPQCEQCGAGPGYGPIPVQRGYR